MADIALFVATSAALTIAPGPDNLQVLARGISQATDTTAPVSQVLGICATAVLSSGNTTPVDVNIGFVD